MVCGLTSVLLQAVYQQQITMERKRVEIREAYLSSGHIMQLVAIGTSAPLVSHVGRRLVPAERNEGALLLEQRPELQQQK